MSEQEEFEFRLRFEQEQSQLPKDVRKPMVELNPVQRAIQSSRSGSIPMNPFGNSIPMTPLGAIPMNGREAMDLPRVALLNLALILSLLRWAQTWLMTGVTLEID
jgi:hypothetical protein